MLQAIDDFLSGKKTYIVAILSALIAGYEAYTATPVPAVVYTMLAAVGLGTLRAGLNK